MHTPVQLILRYRDLVAPTLEAHRQVLTSCGHVWWGWWKRPRETAHPQAWQALQRQIDTHGKARVGLFDSGTGQVHAAWADAIRPPTDPHATSVIPLSEQEQKGVPGYYRNSPYSRAWLRLVAIDAAPLQSFFGAYCIDEPPEMPDFPPHILERLRGKVILDGGELGGMDTTLWQVRPVSGTEATRFALPDRSLDAKNAPPAPQHVGPVEFPVLEAFATLSAPPTQVVERLITATHSVFKPVSAGPIPVKGDLILHITDPHFAVGAKRKQHVWRLESEPASARQTMAEALGDALKGRSVGMVLVTGDLTFLNTPEEFAEARRGLERLRGILDLGTEHVVLVPGNHDMHWTREESETYNAAAEVELAPESAEKAWRDFFKSFYGFEANRWLSMGRRYVFPHGLVEICAVNSNSLEQGKNFLAGMGRVQEAALSNTLGELGWKESSLALRLLALHHHLTPTEDLEEPSEFYKGFGMAIDAPRIQRLAAKHGVQLALHGHKHRAFIWRSNVYELPENTRPNWKLGELSIIGGGSAGSSSVANNSNYFNLIQVTGKGVHVEMFRSQNRGSFELFQSWNGAFSIVNGRLALEDWEKAR